MPSIFISHAAQDPEWPATAVESVAQQLKERGAIVHLDHWVDLERGRVASDDEWRRWMRFHLDVSDHVLCLCSKHYALLSERVADGWAVGRGVAFESSQLEQWLYDRKQNNSGRIWVLQPEGATTPRYLHGICPVYRAPQQQAALIDHLCRPNAASRQDALKRRMHAMLDEECIDLYVTLGGRHNQDRVSRLRVPRSTKRHLRDDDPLPRENIATEHADLLDVVQHDTRALLLGEAGAGKTFALLKVLQFDLDAGRQPLWIKLNHWLDGTMPFERFVAQQTPDYGDDWPALAAADRCRLLIDGLNELPFEHSAEQTKGMAEWLKAHPDCPLLISCRDTDLPLRTFDFIRERLLVRSLRAGQIRKFVHNYLAANGLSETDTTDAVFWALLGGEPLAAAWARRPSDTSDAVLDDLAEGLAARATWLRDEERKSLAALLTEPARPYAMATNPYLLAMLLWVWIDDGGGRDLATVPRRRVQIFDRYASARLRGELEKVHQSSLDAEEVQDALSALAARLQQVAERTGRAVEAGVLALPWAEVDDGNRAALQIALGARILRREGELIRFRHQLLQEFYVARFLRQRLAAGEDALLAGVWSTDQPLWQRAGWVQPFLLLAEYEHADVPALLRTLVEIQPEVAGAVWTQTRQQNPLLLSDGLATEIAALLTARMLPPAHSVDFPKREGAYGRGLGLMRLHDGRPLDRRPGVWGWYDPLRGRAEVDIDWVRIPAGSFIYQGKPLMIDRDFLISRYPITQSQFLAFVEDPGGWRDPRWWGDASKRDHFYTRHQRRPYDNHPVTDVGWWEAQAYCRWLAANRGEAIALATEEQWERAAAGTEGLGYPWGGEWSDQKSNANKTIGSPTFCGLFALSCSREGVHELSGNVWEWTQGRFGPKGSSWWAVLKYAAFARFSVDVPRAIRGGSWTEQPEDCRNSYRNGGDPGFRGDDLGFRVVCRLSIDH